MRRIKRDAFRRLLNRQRRRLRLSRRGRRCAWSTRRRRRPDDDLFDDARLFEVFVARRG